MRTFRKLCPCLKEGRGENAKHSDTRGEAEKREKVIAINQSGSTQGSYRMFTTQLSHRGNFVMGKNVRDRGGSISAFKRKEFFVLGGVVSTWGERVCLRKEKGKKKDRSELNDMNDVLV